MSPRKCPHDQTILIEAKQLFFPVNLQSVETTRLKAMFSASSGIQPQPFACPVCGYVGFFLEPEQVAELVSQ